MKKKEAIYLHVLLCEVRNHMEDRGRVREQDFAAYEDLGIDPIRFDQSKTVHEEALLVLASELERALTDERVAPL